MRPFAAQRGDRRFPIDGPARIVLATFLFACLLSIAVFPEVWAAMVRVWSNSETFAHGFIALPCAAWMLWRRRDDWYALPRRGWWPGAIALAACGVVWLVGHLAGVSSLEQFGVVGIIPATMLLMVGPAVTRAIAFPLAFLFFAVPVGEFLSPIMMNYTADATVAAIRWSGVPVFREGLHFTLPTGRWSVVEACSGLRYLIASLALGVLYAYLQFRTLRYRLAFVALAIVTPIVANWIRAYGIVMLGHVSDMRIAAGADHLIYGWVFFGFVMALLFWVGSRWHEPPEPAPNDGKLRWADGAADGVDRSSRRVSPKRAWTAFAAVAIIVAVLWRPLAANLVDQTQPIDGIGPLHVAVESFPKADPLDFEPRFADAAATLRSARAIDGIPVDAHAFYYARQHATHEMIHGSHSVVRVDDFTTRIVSRGTQKTPWGTVATYRLRRDAGPLLAWQWYAVGGTQTANEYLAKAATAWSLVTGRGDHSIAVVLVTPLRTGPSRTTAEELSAATQRLTTLADALQPAISKVMSAESGTAPALADATPARPGAANGAQQRSPRTSASQ